MDNLYISEENIVKKLNGWLPTSILKQNYIFQIHIDISKIPLNKSNIVPTQHYFKKC
jgi:hypothetical protein